MGFYLSYAGYELKKWLRDSLTAFVLTYPVLLGLAGRYLVPFAEKQAGFNLAPYYHVVLVFLGLMTAKIMGAVAAFSILDDRDDNILLSVKVAPLSLAYFIGLKLFMVYIASFFGTAFVLWFSNLVELSAGVIFGISFLAAIAGPITALLINVIASNKVEGFAGLKGMGILIVFPVVSLFFFDAKEFIFAFEPGFWPAKALSTAILGREAYQLGYNAYYFIGLVYAVTVLVVVYRAFQKKVQ